MWSASLPIAIKWLDQTQMIENNAYSTKLGHHMHTNQQSELLPQEGWAVK